MAEALDRATSQAALPASGVGAAGGSAARARDAAPARRPAGVVPAPTAAERGQGLASVVAVYLIWGVMPAYWKLGVGIQAAAVMAHRAIWAFAIMAVVYIAGIPKRRLRGSPARGKVALCALSSATLFIQWAAYLAAVNTGRLVDISLGYFIFPVIVAPLGALLLKERLGPTRIVALVLAAAGVGAMIWAGGGVPVIALVLAVSFAAYSVLKKTIRLESVEMTFYELAYMLSFALAYAVYAEIGGPGAFVGCGRGAPAFLIGGGVATAATLLFFAVGTRRIPIATVGLLQYISPTMVLLLGILVYGERFGGVRAAVFGLVWLGLLIDAAPFVVSGIRRMRADRAVLGGGAGLA